MSIFSFLKWYPTRSRVGREVERLEGACGSRAFLVAIQRYWFAKSDNDRARAGFWKAVSAEVIRRERRRSIVAAALGRGGAGGGANESLVPADLCERTFG